MFERYTEKARRVIFYSRYEASRFGAPYIESEYLLLGLLREDRVLTDHFLRQPGAIEKIRERIESSSPVRESISTSVDLPLSDECKRILAYTAEEAERAGHEHIGTVHLLAGTVREEGCFAATLLRETGVTLDRVREYITTPAKQPAAPQTAPRGTLVERARLGQEDDCVEILWGTVRVGIAGLAATTHIPREGDEIIINDAAAGLRSFRVKDVTYYYETEPPSPGAPQHLSKVIVRVAKSGEASDPRFTIAPRPAYLDQVLIRDNPRV